MFRKKKSFLFCIQVFLTLFKRKIYYVQREFDDKAMNITLFILLISGGYSLNVNSQEKSKTSPFRKDT